MTSPQLIVWSTRLDGVVEISTDGEHYTVPELAGSELASMWRVLAYEDLIVELSNARGVPPAWTVGLVRQESGGDPRIHNGQGDGGVGLLQITGALKGKHTDEDLYDPRLNLTIGIGLISDIQGSAFDLPATCSMFNAGQPCITPDNRYVPCHGAPLGSRPSQRPWSNEAWLANGRHEFNCSRWGFACSPGHIDSVVRGSNWYILHRASEKEA